jgi:outer membrane protein assembly factor BamB
MIKMPKLKTKIIIILIGLLIGTNFIQATNAEIIKKCENNDISTNSNDIDWWPMAHHDCQNTGFTSSNAPEEHFLIWEYKPESSNSPSITVIDNYRMYLSTIDDLICLNSLNGKEIWVNTTGNFQKNPTIANGSLYIEHRIDPWETELCCYDCESSEQIWNYKIADYSFSIPAISNNKVYIGLGNGNITCLDADSGSKIWSYKTEGRYCSTPAIFEGKVYVRGSNPNRLYCLNADSGNKIWSFTGANSIPIVNNGKVYVVGHQDYNNGKLYSLDNFNGKLIWTFDLNFDFPELNIEIATAYDKIFVNCDKYGDCKAGILYCISEISGTEIWSLNINVDGLLCSYPAIADGKIYVNAKDLICLNVDNGEMIWNYPKQGVEFFHFQSPIIADGKVYITLNDKLCCFGDEKGNIAPDKPEINGDRSGKIDENKSFNLSTIDPNGNDVFYYVDWGDGNNSGWKGPYKQGKEISIEHSWIETGFYKIKCKAKDIFNEESEWSDPLTITIPRSKPITISFRAKILKIFPIFQQFL